MVATVTESIIVGTDTEDDMTDGMQVCHLSRPSRGKMYPGSLPHPGWHLASLQCKCCHYFACHTDVGRDEPTGTCAVDVDSRGWIQHRSCRLAR